MDFSVIEFDGQQTGERILARLKPHPARKYVNMALLFLAMLFIFAFLTTVFSYLKLPVMTISPPLIIILSLIVVVGYIWNSVFFKNTVTYLTDRRVIRFEAVTPFHTAKRELFWTEVLKAKAYAANMFMRIVRVGEIVIEPMMDHSENIMIKDIYLYDDAANYIDKILYLSKNKPEDLANLNRFIPRPRGQRDEVHG